MLGTNNAMPIRTVFSFFSYLPLNFRIRNLLFVNNCTQLQVQRRLRDIPSWVHFPEQEKAEWLNKVLKKLWPFVNRYVEDFLRQQVEPQVSAHGIIAD